MDGASSKTVSDTIRQASKVLLVTHSRPSVDALCATAVLYNTLRVHYKKEVDVVIPTDLGPRYKMILDKTGLTQDQLLTDLPQRMYTIKIKKQGEKIESINFNEEDDTFNFVITPFNGKLDLNSVVIDETGANYDLIVSADVASLNFLGDFYKKNNPLFTNTPIISFDSHKSNAGYAKLNVTYDVDTTSQVVFRFLEEIGAPIEESSATLLFAGIQSFLNLGLRGKVRSSSYEDLGRLINNKASSQAVDDMLYSPYNLNEIFLVGDILDSSNEGNAKNLNDIKVVGCKISLNKEELLSVDIDKAAQVVLWNIKVTDSKLAYVIFQKSPTESVAFIYAYDQSLNIIENLKNLNGKGDKISGKVVFEMDMNAAESALQNEFGISFVKAENKFMAPQPSVFGEDFDFDNEFYDDGMFPKVENNPAPLFDAKSLGNAFSSPQAPIQDPVQTDNDQQSNDSDDEDEGKSKMFDPRVGG